MPHEAFICYSSHDKAVAEAVCAALESRHIRCWIAPRDVLPGSEWAEAIVDAIDGSSVLVLVLSSSSNSSSQVIREVGRAASKDIPIIPLQIDNVPLSKAMEFFVSSHHFFDAQTPPLKKHLQRLADTVQQLLTRKRAPQEVIEIAEAEEARKVKEAEERAEREAELAAKEKAKREAEEARRAKEAEERAEEKPAVSAKKPAEAVKAVTKPNIWFWSGIVLLSLGLGSLTMVTMILLGEEMATWELLIGMLMFVLPLVIPGVYCLRRGMTQELRTKPAEGAVPNWWWLLPVVLAFVGGIISWTKQKDVNWRKAMNMLTLGIIATLIWTIPLFVLFTPVPPPPPPPPIPAPTPAPTPTPIVPGIPVTLKYETFLPSSSTLVVADTWFFNEVASLSGGRIETEYHYEVPYSATESPLLQAVGNGDVDCGLIPLAAIPHLIPLSQGLTLNYLTCKPDALALAAREVYDTFTPLREEWEVNNNAKVLYFLPLDTLALCTTRPVSGVADLKGLYISSFVWTVDTLQRLGAEPVVVPSTDIYTALEIGVIDGSFQTLEGISSLGLFDVAKYLTEPWAGPYGIYATVINKDVWDSLPADVKSLMEELRDDTLEYYIGLIMEANREAIKEMVTAGVNFYLWPESEREIAKNRVQPAQAQAWIEEVGTSGQELITRLQEELSVYEPQSTYKSGLEYSPKLMYGELIAFSSDRDGDWEIYVMSPDGSNVIKLTDNTAMDSTPALSPDGKKIAFGSDRDGDREIYVMNSDGSNLIKLTSNSIVDLQPSWSPDGKKIAFRSGESVGATGIYVMNADGSNSVRLTESHAFISNQAWSADGSEIVFSLIVDGAGEIYVMNSADGSNKRRLIEPAFSQGEKMHESLPAWSPIGNKIVFYSFRHGFIETGPDAGTVTGEIFVMHSDGSNLVRLTYDLDALDYDASWSPDGKKIIFASDRDGDREIYVMNSDGSNLIKLTDNAAEESGPSWTLAG